MKIIGGLINGFIEIARSTGSALSGVVAPVRAKDGTYGTQRMHSKAIAERRRIEFPTD